MKNNIVILANGEIPSHDIPMRLLRQAEKIICCDGAVNKLISLGFTPSVIVGDCDSISADNLEKFRHLLVIDKDVEYNDLNKALQYCLKQGYSGANILGGFGLREDHALSNLGVMMMFAERDGMDLEMVTNNGVFTPAFSTISLQSYPGQQISVFSLSDTDVMFHQLKYPVIHRRFKYLWEGGLNEALTDHFTIEFSEGQILIYRSF